MKQEQRHRLSQGGRSLGAAQTGKKAPPLAPWLTQTHFLVFHYHLALPILLLPSIFDGDDVDNVADDVDVWLLTVTRSHDDAEDYDDDDVDDYVDEVYVKYEDGDMFLVF